MPQERPNERMARFIVSEVLGCPVRRYEDGSVPSQVDAEIHYPRGRAALEVVGDMDEQSMKQWRALDKHHHRVSVPGLARRWIVGLEPWAPINQVVDLIPGLVQQLDDADARWAVEDVPAELRRMGVDQIFPIEHDERPGGVVHFVTAGEGGMVPDVLDVDHWLGNFFQRHQDVPRKLWRHPTPEGHAFVWITMTSELAFEFLTSHGLPATPPTLPRGVTHLWLAASTSASPSPLLWFPDRGWWRPDWSMPADGRLDIPDGF